MVIFVISKLCFVNCTVCQFPDIRGALFATILFPHKNSPEYPY